ncbi:nucleotide exchange factor GrpE [Micromonospora sp. DT48]|uniref:nucleotide exchange factor GrpE n=1 Tax=unclassified Micromonospora TaxID=2617518 RepID=UPI0012BC0381|nr:nucleotide exchange factor GrpE [Micromonospora sp. CP22]MTK04212.1 nucleotide exchange factor GrpE [Micromonospora sp. CP22]
MHDVADSPEEGTPADPAGRATEAPPEQTTGDPTRSEETAVDGPPDSVERHDDGLTGLVERLGDELADVADRLGGELAALRVELARSQDRAKAREQVIDRLHEDNQRLRAGERRLLLRPLLTDLQRLRHDLLRTAAGLPPTFDVAAAADMLRSYAANLELTLERGGITVLSPTVGATFDPSRQRATGTVIADDPGQDGTVADVVLDGYHDVEAGRTVVPAAVRVHRWTADPEPTAVEPASPPETGPQPTPTP